MNSLAARRAILRAAAGFALLPLLSSRSAFAATGAAVAPIAPPASDMIYRRMLQRQLAGDVTLTTTRDFLVRFSATGNGGYLVDGNQVSAHVDAPENLASLARLEERRVESGLFPLSLDASGTIVDGTDMPVDLNVALALDEVQRRFVDHGAEVSELLDAISASGARLTAYLPKDLFAPTSSATEQREVITLPWGQTGEVRMRFTAMRNPDTRLMRFATREVVTVLEGEKRRSSERWELFAA